MTLLKKAWLASFVLHAFAFFVLSTGPFSTSQNEVKNVPIFIDLMKVERVFDTTMRDSQIEAPPFINPTKPAQQALKQSRVSTNERNAQKKTFKTSPKPLAEGDFQKSTASQVTPSGNSLGEKPIETEENAKGGSPPSSGPVEEYLVSTMPVLVKKISVVYPVKAREANIQGKVMMELIINETGKVMSVKVLSGPGYGLNEAAEAAARNLIFRPALMSGKPVAVKVHFTHMFVLEKS